MLESATPAYITTLMRHGLAPLQHSVDGLVLLCKEKGY